MLKQIKYFLLVFGVVFAVLTMLHFSTTNFWIFATLSSLLVSSILYIFLRQDFDILHKELDNILQNNLEPSKNKFLLLNTKELDDKLDKFKLLIKEKNSNLLKKSAKLRLKNTQLKGILSSISHEFKNPISIIKICTQTLVKEKDMEYETRVKFIEKLEKNSQKLSNLIDRLNLKDTQNITLHRTNFDLSKLCLEVKDELLDKYKNRNIIVSQEKVTVYADEALIKQVLQNFVENSLKYTTKNVQIIFKDECVLVCDEGNGISAKNIKLITKKYYKTDDNIGTNSFGLGLYIAKQILKMHGFALIIQSDLGKGSAFGFRYRQI